MKIQLCCIKDNDVTKCGDIVEVDLTEDGIVFPDNEIYSLDWMEQTHTAVPLFRRSPNDTEKPMTIEEVKMSLGKTVFLRTQRHDDWSILHSYEEVGGLFVFTKRSGVKERLRYEEIGKTWNAYKHEPFKITNGGILDNDDFGALCNCAVRYALGRQSYMPYLVCRYLKKILRNLNWKTIGCMERDIREADKFGGYGDNCDYQEWMGLLGELRKYMDQNGIQRWP